MQRPNDSDQFTTLKALVTIPKAGGGERQLGIPTVRDRIVQQALKTLLEPLFEPDFHPSSYGYRPGRSAHQAISKAQLFIRRYQREWVVDMDLSKCFDTLNHALILQQFREKVSDSSILSLLRQFLESGVMVGIPRQLSCPVGDNYGGRLSW